MRAAYIAILLASSSVAAHADQSGRARDVTPDPALFFPNFSEPVALHGRESLLVTSGRAGFRRSDSRGEHWRRAMDGFVDSAGVEPLALGLCQAPSAPSTIYSASGGNFPGRPIFRTDDHGKTWRSTATVAEAFYNDCAVDPSDPETLYVLALDANTFAVSLLKSIDGGQTMVPLAGFPQLDGAFKVRVSPTRPQTVYVANDTGDLMDGVYVSSDGGGSFARLPASPREPLRIAAHPTHDGLLFVTAIDGLFRSSDGGTTFAQVGPSTADAVAFDPDDAAAVYLSAGRDGVYRSQDFGLTFVRLPGPTAAQVGPTGILGVAVAPSQGRKAIVYVTTDRGPFRSDDGGNAFAPISDTYRGAAVNDLGIDAAGRLMVAAYHTVLLFRAEMAGRPRTYKGVGESVTTTYPDVFGQWNGTAVAPSRIDANAAVVATLFNGVFSTTDGGATWSKATFTPFEPFLGPNVRAAFAQTSANRVYLVAGGGLFRSDDGGRSFQSTFRLNLGTLAVDPTNADVVYLATLGGGLGLFKSVDGGRTAVSLGVRGNFSALSIEPRNVQTIYAANRAGGVLRSVDGGATWTSASTGLPPSREVLAAAVDPQIPGRVYAWVKAGGLFVSADAGANWTAVDTGEALRRSGNEAGRAALVVDPAKPGRVYIGNSGVVQIDTLAGSEE
jgi:photosystem II stability/assembly factor-like uncharacterized protein